MSLIVRAIRNAPPEYPWEHSARGELMARIDLRWRSYCLVQAVSAIVDALAAAIGPGFSTMSRKEQRQLTLSHLERSREYVRMAANRWRL